MTKSAKETNMNELITAMVGRVLENRFPPVDNQPKDVILSIQHLSTKYEPYLQDVTFDVREGEIFGLYGLVGAGRTELLETIFGIRTRAAGRVYLNHKLMNFSCAKEAMDYGFALITEERKANGLFLKGNLTFNTTIANLNAYKKGAALSEPKMTKATANEIKVMHTKCLGPNDMISSLSGGNQQKVIFGKWLEREPKVFMMDEPTRGIDVGAKYEIYDLIIQMAKQGKTIIVVSSEMPEILGITNRIDQTFAQPSESLLKKNLKESVKKQKEKGNKLEPVVISGRAIAKSWWGKAWCDNLEHYADFASRLERGKRYVRTGTVIDLKIQKGKIIARVQGTRKTPYRVEIRISPLTEQKCEAILDRCGKIETLERLLSGDFPDEMKELFQGEDGLFPQPSEISFQCSCPDWALMCKHVAAALYGVGARLDMNPALFFELRGIEISSRS